MTRAEPSPHQRYRALVNAIERDCRVAEWRAGDVDLWPLASQDLFLDVFRRSGGETGAKAPPFGVRAATSLATPVINLWKSRHDLAHWVGRPHRADAIVLGDGVSLDRVDGAWQDRFGEPVATALERRGRTCFVMQSGDLGRLPWARPTFAANRIAGQAALAAALTKGPATQLPDHPEVMRIVEQAGVEAPSLSPEGLARRGRRVAAQAALFERVLRRVLPSLAFVTTYYAGLGHAFALACRRQGILCVDLQHCPHDGMHRAYNWSRLPSHGYSTVPGLFWSWSGDDAANIRRWADGRWHDAIAAGHPQVAALPASERERLWQEGIASIGDVRRYDREILVALQPIGGRRDVWEALARAIESAPPTWRWWIRRHPAATPAQDREYECLLSLGRRELVIGAPAQMPLPALLAHMHAVVSLASGAAAEAAMFKVPAFFLDEEASDVFPGLISRGQATLVEVETLVAAIARRSPDRAAPCIEPPPIEATLATIDRLCDAYAALSPK